MNNIAEMIRYCIIFLLKGRRKGRRVAADVRQRRPGVEPVADRQPGGHRERVADRRERGVGRVLRRPDRRGARLQPGADGHRDPDGHELPDRRALTAAASSADDSGSGRGVRLRRDERDTQAHLPLADELTSALKELFEDMRTMIEDANRAIT